MVVEIISGRLAVSMDLWGRDGMLWKSIFMSRISMNIIERNKENDSYRPRNICTGYTGVTFLSRVLEACLHTARKRYRHVRRLSVVVYYLKFHPPIKYRFHYFCRDNVKGHYHSHKKKERNRKLTKFKYLPEWCER